MNTYPAVYACTVALFLGAVLHASDVTAGNGLVVDWRTIKSGEEIQAGGDAVDTARLFVALVGPEKALAAVAEPVEPAPEPRIAPRVHAFMEGARGGRRRSFEAGPFKVVVEPCEEDDAAQAAFTARLAAFCEGMG